MKKSKLLKVLACGCLAGAMCAGGLALSGCAWTTDTAEGVYHYTNYGVDYGVKVNVEVQTDEKGDRIRQVTIVDSDYTQLSEARPDYGWTDENRQNYIDNEQALLDSYRGLYVADVLAMEVGTAANGEPTSVPGDAPLITGATQSSGRLLLAVQDALCNFGYSIFEGEYHYPNAWDSSAPHYGIRVRLVMKGNVVQKVAVLNSDYTEVSSGWDGASTWNNGLDVLLDSYVGRTKREILEQVVTVSSTGQPDSVSDSSYIITGATQGSGRLLLAIQNALDPLGEDTTKVYNGEYKYENPYAAGSYYGVKVSVTVKGSIIQSVSIVDSDYTQLSPANPDYGWTEDSRQNYLNNEAGLLGKYAGLSVGEVLSMTVETSESGEPSSVSDEDLVITGATQSSGRLLLAVQNALATAGTGNGGSQTPEEPEEPSNPYEDWKYNQYIDPSTTYTVNSDGSVDYSIVTTSNSPAGSFEISITVANGEIAEYNIDTNGSVGSNKNGPYGEQMAAIAKNMVGQTQASLEEFLESDDLHTGATRSNELCIYAGLFALANADNSVGGGETYEGEYGYVAWGTNYGIKVSVTVSDNTIQNVTVLDSDYVEVTDSWDNKNIWIDGLNGLLATYNGKTVGEILSATVVTDDTGVPGSVSDSSLMISGATQGSGRLLLAVKNALTNAGYSVYEGEYGYTAWGTSYGIKVNVVVKDDVVVSVEVADSDYVEVTDSWDNKNIWIDGLNGLLSAYSGKTVGEILSATVVTDDTGVPGSVSDSSLMISGATQGSGRLLLAVQNALNNGGYEVLSGEYKYENAWVPGSYYGIAVNVVVKDGIVVTVSVADSDYTEVTDSWDNKNIWLDGLDSLLAAYEGRTVSEILSATVVTAEGGQPESVSDSSLMISGATQGSGRLLLAVQNALTNAGYSVYEGEYGYTAWGTNYGIKVNVVVRDDVVVSVEVADSDYVEVTDSWADKDIWINGLEGLLNSYSGKTVAEILSATVVTDDTGVPGSVSDSSLMITGATQGSGRLLLAVQNALQKIAQ